MDGSVTLSWTEKNKGL